MTKTELYVHIPFCIQKCNYCDFISGVYDVDIRKRYVKALIKELIYHSQRMNDCEIVSIYIGGGTPTWLEVKLMDKIMKTIYKNFHVNPTAEVTIECNPKTSSEKDFNEYASMHINRISIGLQSANENELKTLGRVHEFEHFVSTYEYARKAGFENINVDIMTGIPGQTPGTLMNTIDKVCSFHPEHISCYSLIIEENTPFFDSYQEDLLLRQKGQPTKLLPNEDEEYELYKTAQSELLSRGYGQYEISNYSKMGKNCRHNIGYWKRVPYLGVGIGAASLLDEIRYKNMTDIYEYMEHIEQNDFLIYQDVTPVKRKYAIEEFMFLGLRMTEGISRKDFFDAFGLRIDDVYGEVMEQLSAKKLLEQLDGRILLTDSGMDLGNYVFLQFLLDENWQENSY